MTTKQDLDEVYGAFRLVKFYDEFVDYASRADNEEVLAFMAHQIEENEPQNYEVLKQGGMNESEATELAAELHCQIEHQDPDSKIWYSW